MDWFRQYHSRQQAVIQTYVRLVGAKKPGVCRRKHPILSREMKYDKQANRNRRVSTRKVVSNDGTDLD